MGVPLFETQLQHHKDEPLPGLVFMQATHVVASALFSTIQVSHSHAPSAFLNLSPNPTKPVEMGGAGASALMAEKADGIVSEVFSPVPGLAVSQATHFTASALFLTRHVSQSQVPTGLVNTAANPAVVVEVVLLLSSPSKVAVDGLLSSCVDEEELGLGVIQQTHFVSDGLFCTKQTSQFHPGGGLNGSPNPAEELREEVVVMAVVGDGEAVVCCGASSGHGPG